MGVVQTHLDSWSAGTGESRQVTGGATLHALSLVICQQVVLEQFTVGHTLETEKDRWVNKNQDRIAPTYCFCPSETLYLYIL